MGLFVTLSEVEGGLVGAQYFTPKILLAQNDSIRNAGEGDILFDGRNNG